METKKFRIEGMTCASCVQVIEEAVAKNSMIGDVKVNFATEMASVQLRDSHSESIFFELLKSLGYRAISQDQEKDSVSNNDFESKILRHSIISIVLSSLMMVMMLPSIHHLLPFWPMAIYELVATTVILFYFGKSYLVSVWYFIKSGKASMHTLIGIGAWVSYLYSIWILVFHPYHGHVFFEGASFIIAFALLGSYFDLVAKRNAKSALSSLYKIQIKFTKKIDTDGRESSVPVIDIVPGDIIKVLPGEKVPLDGTLGEGFAHFDESFITGESRIITKQVGDLVYAGSLNRDTTAKIIVNSTIHQTFVAKVIDYVESAQMRRPKIQQFADKIVSVFVPLLLLLSFMTFLGHLLSHHTFDQAIHYAIAVIVVACPCGIGLAVPMAVMISTSQAARIGLLIKGADVIEKAQEIDTIVFDKTGTLTEGNPSVIKVIDFDHGDDSNNLLAASLVELSQHPLSMAIAHFHQLEKEKLIDPDSFKVIPGKGIHASLNSLNLSLGNLNWMIELGMENVSNIDRTSIEREGSNVYLAINQKIVRVYVIADALRSESKEVISRLIQLGKEIWIVSGDHFEVTQQMAEKLGGVQFKSGVLPVQKAEFIRELKEQQKRVLMVGDGINDAPALSLADLSVAMGSGSDIAIEASDLTLLKSDLHLIINFLSLSQLTMKVIKQNLFFSFLYNVLMIPLAAGLLKPSTGMELSPMIGSLLMGLSSVSVILSSLRLKKVNYLN